MQFALEITNKELDNELQIIQCDVNERLLAAEEQIRLSLQESLCKLQYERAAHQRKASKGESIDLIYSMVYIFWKQYYLAICQKVLKLY